NHDNPAPPGSQSRRLCWRTVSLVDLHTHVLPGVDDGARDLAASLEMARLAVANGVGTIVATPHVREDFLHTADGIRPAVRALQDEFDAGAIDCRVVPGAEVAATMLLDLDEEALRALCLADGPYVLVETP